MPPIGDPWDQSVCGEGAGQSGATLAEKVEIFHSNGNPSLISLCPSQKSTAGLLALAKTSMKGGHMDTIGPSHLRLGVDW
jgi:hypothetical protein